MEKIYQRWCIMFAIQIINADMFEINDWRFWLCSTLLGLSLDLFKRDN